MVQSPRNRGLPPGTRMGRYELISRLGAGGMAELYAARLPGPQGFERTVAIKRVLPHLTEDTDFVRMLLDEARIACILDHPNIAQVTDVDEQDGEFFLAMEYVHGKNLKQVLQGAREPLPLELAVFAIACVAGALHHAHEALGPDGRPLGLVHRDVSPQNVMIAYNGTVKLTDFGIAKASAHTQKTMGGQIKGKVGYMSPEQCRAEVIDRRSDVFALGILLYEATTRARAFHAPNDFAAMGKIARVDYIPPREIDPDYPPQLAAIIDHALQKNPEDRYATAELMQRELRAFAEIQSLAASEVEMAAYMEGSFGNPAHPQTIRVEPPVEPKAQRRAGVSLPLVALGVTAAFGAGLAFAFGGSEESSADPEVVQAPPSEPEPEPELSEPEPEPEPEPELSEPEPEAEAPPEPEAEPKRSTRRSRKKRRRPTKKAEGPSPYPPGYER